MSLVIPKKQLVEIRRLARVHGVARLRVFGSRGRAGARASSDLDLLVDLEPGAISWIWRDSSWISKRRWAVRWMS